MKRFSELKTLLQEGAFEVNTPSKENPIYTTLIFVDGDADCYAYTPLCTDALAQSHIQKVQSKQKSLVRHANALQLTIQHGAKFIGGLSFLSIAPMLEQYAHHAILALASMAGYGVLQWGLQKLCQHKFKGIMP